MIKKTTKILTLLLAGLLIISSMSALSVSANTTPTISADTVEIEQGEGEETVTIPVNFEGDLTLTSLTVEVAYDAGVKYVKGATGSALTAGSGITSPEGATINPVSLQWYSNNFSGDKISSGTLATFTFTVPKTEAKDYNFTLTLFDVWDATSDITNTIKTVNGKVTVKAPAAPAVPTISAGSVEIEQGEGEETVTIPVNFEGDLTLTSLTVEVAYDAGVKYVKGATGSALTAGSGITSPEGATINPVSLQWYSNNFSGDKISSGTLATFTFTVPKTVAKEYNFTITLYDIWDATSDITNTIKTVNGKVTVKGEPVTGPVVTFTDASGATVEDVVAGTMNMSVALNGDTSDLIMFAIYTKEGDFAVMKYQTDATIENGVATAQLQNIKLENGKNYYAKAFIWDAATYYGSVVTLGE